MQFSEDKKATMRAAFQADLATRIADIEGIIEQLQARRLSQQEAAGMALAHLHDIKGCSTPYGFPEAAQLARHYEVELRKPAPSQAALRAVLIRVANEFRHFTSQRRNCY